MQVRHEGQLIEPTVLVAQDFQLPGGAKTLDSYTLRNQSLLSPIELIASSPAHGSLLAVYLSGTNQVELIELGSGEPRRVRFALKSCDSKKFSKLSFAAKALAFSPDGTRLAVGQTDCVIYIYKIGAANELDSSWRASVVGKFVCSSPVTCLVWTEVGIAFGNQDGKIKLISRPAEQVGATRVLSWYSSAGGSSPVLLVARPAGQLLVAFLDGSLVQLAGWEPAGADQTAERRPSVGLQLAGGRRTDCWPPLYLAVLANNTLCLATCDGRLSLSPVAPAEGACQELELRECLVGLDYSAANELLVAATPTKLLFLRQEPDSNRWQVEASSLQVSGGLSCVRWSRDGARLALGTRAGSLELLECRWRARPAGEQLDICHIARNRVRISDRARNLLATYKSAHAIKRVHLLDGGQSVVVWTAGSLLLARLACPTLQSELERDKGAAYKVTFDHAGFVLLHRPAHQELQVVRLGRDGPVLRLRASRPRRAALSARLFPLPQALRAAYEPRPEGPAPAADEGAEPEVQRFACALDGNPLRVHELGGGLALELAWAADARWLSLSASGRCLALRDAHNGLHALQLGVAGPHSRPAPMLAECAFAGWLPDSDVLVGQAGWRICVWFAPEQPSRPLQLDARALHPSRPGPPLVDLSLGGGGGEGAWPRLRRLGADWLELANGARAQLDRLEVALHVALAGAGRLARAQALLERAPPPPRRRLWAKLGWLAVARCEAPVALAAFRQLGHAHLAAYLEAAVGAEPDECARQMAKLAGDWRQFERLSEPDEVLATYRRLNKWSLAADYLAARQQFRQRDLLEEEQRAWLLARGRPLEGARLQARAGDLEGALNLLLERDELAGAAQLLLAERAPSAATLRPQVQLLARRLVEAPLPAEAAQVHERLLGQPREAVRLYLAAEQFEEALRLAQQVPLEAAELRDLRAKLGDSLLHRFRAHRLSRRAALAAPDHLLAAGRATDALDAALELRDAPGALKLLRVAAGQLSAEELSSRATQVADHLLAVGLRAAAVEALELGRQHERVVELHLAAGDVEAAWAVALDRVHGGDRGRARESFCAIAGRLVAAEAPSDEQVERAERIYLALDEPELAIELCRRLGRHERLLELVERHRPQLLEDTLVRLAAEAEAAGELELAERHLLRGAPGEWPSVVRMYRLRERWEEAFRVARAHCASERDPLLVQLAFWWARSLAGGGRAEEARRLLSEQLHLLSQVVEFCCENRSFGLALELCPKRAGDAEGAALRARVVRGHARHLTAERRPAEAERLLLAEGQPDEAVRLHLQAGRVAEAVGVAERAAADEGAPAELLQQALLEGARRLEDELALAAAQQLYLRAQRPELAVEMYRGRGLWREALGLAQRFAPQLLEGVEAALDAECSRELAPIVAEAQRRRPAAQSPERPDEASALAAWPASLAEDRPVGVAELQQALAATKAAFVRLAWPASEEACRDWRRLRDALLGCVEAAGSRLAAGAASAFYELHQLLLLGHLLALHGFLVAEAGGPPPSGLDGRRPSGPLGELLAELSWRLLAHAHLLEPLGAHYEAARWLGAGRARLALGRLLEVAPEEEADARAARKLEEARQWLLRDLCAPQTAGEPPEAWPRAAHLDEACLACGRPLAGADLVSLGERLVGGRRLAYRVHAPEWRLLSQQLGRRAHNPCEFLRRLAGER